MPTPPKIVARVCRLYADGLKHTEIAAKLGIHRMTVGRILNALADKPAPLLPGSRVADAVDCDPRWCGKCKVMVTTRPCIACRTREWQADRK